MRILLVACFLLAAVPAAAEEIPSWYARAEGGQAVSVPWLGGRVGRVFDDSFSVDVGAGGSPEGRGAVAVTGGLEARALTRHRLSFFTRAETGVLASPSGDAFLVVSLGGGLAVRLDPRWSLRGGFARSLKIGDSVRGPDTVYVGLERRW